MNDTKTVEKRPRRGDSGEALLEIALVLPILLLLSLGMLDFGRAFHAKNIVDQAARESARVAAVSNDDKALATQRATDIMTGSGLAANAINVSDKDASGMVTVQVTYRFTFVTPGLFAVFSNGLNDAGGINMTGKSVMRVE
jgi:Flp pilus assembly protein TadG